MYLVTMAYLLTLTPANCGVVSLSLSLLAYVVVVVVVVDVPAAVAVVVSPGLFPPRPKFAGTCPE